MDLTLFFRKKFRDRQIALASVIVEAKNPRIFTKFWQFLGDGGEGCSRPCGQNRWSMRKRDAVRFAVMLAAHAIVVL